MKLLKATLDLAVLAYILFATLLLATILNENTIFSISSKEQVLILYKTLVGIGVGLMLLKLLVNHLYITTLKHERHKAQLKINELKADLYEKRQEFRNSKSYREELQAQRAQEAEINI